MNSFKVKYTGPGAAEIRSGEVYDAQTLHDTASLIGVKDRSGEWYAYPRKYFEIIEERTASGRKYFSRTVQ